MFFVVKVIVSVFTVLSSSKTFCVFLISIDVFIVLPPFQAIGVFLSLKFE